MPDDRKDIKDRAWLQQQLVMLLEDARDQDKTDHQACAKYADLLWKMLPQVRDLDPADKELRDLRKNLIEGKSDNAD